MSALRPLLALIALLTALDGAAAGELVIVVSAKSVVTRLTQDEVIDIFLGRHRELPGGQTATPIDQPKASSTRADFYLALTNKTLSEINAYWARLYFSGKANPPVQAEKAADVLAHVLHASGGIGYLEQDQLDPRLRVVLKLPRSPLTPDRTGE